MKSAALAGSAMRLTHRNSQQKGAIAVSPAQLDSVSVSCCDARRDSTLLAKNTPASNNNHMGMANMICEITSGGVSNIPTTKAPTIIYRRF